MAKTLMISLSVSVVLLAITGLLAALLSREIDAHLADNTRFEASQIQVRCNQYIMRRAGALTAERAFFASSEEVTPAEFERFTRMIVGSVPGLREVHYNDADLTVRMVAPAGVDSNIRGKNMRAMPATRQALEALRSGKATATDPIDLAGGGHGFLIFEPVMKNGKPHGLLVAVNDLEPFLRIMRLEDIQRYYSVAVTDSAGHSIFSSGQPRRGALELPLEMVSRQWKLSLSPLSSWFTYLPVYLAWGIGLGLWLGSLALIWSDAFASMRLSREVAERTADLQQSRDQFGVILNGVADGIMAVGPGGKVIYANRTAARGFDVPEGPLPPNLYSQDLHQRFDFFDEQDHLLTSDEMPGARALRGEEIPGELIRVRPRGTQADLMLLFKATPIREDDEIPMAIVITQNLTERVRLEERLRRQLKELEALDRLKSDFLSVVTHELRTPLTSIKGYAEFLEDGIGGELSPQQLRFVKQVQDSTEQLEALVDDLLDLARLEAGKFTLRVQKVEAVALAGQVIESFRPQAAERKLNLVLEAPAAPLNLEADPTRLRQILSNLLSNALKFTPEGGRVSLSLAQTGDRLTFSVSDTGIGIAAENLPRLFTKFYQVEGSHTRQYKGTGLGLAITKGLVEAHHGVIQAESQLGLGTTLRVSLPLSQPSGTPRLPQEAEPPTDSRA